MRGRLLRAHHRALMRGLNGAAAVCGTQNELVQGVVTMIALVVGAPIFLLGPAPEVDT